MNERTQKVVGGCSSTLLKFRRSVIRRISVNESLSIRVLTCIAGRMIGQIGEVIVEDEAAE